MFNRKMISAVLGGLAFTTASISARADEKPAEAQPAKKAAKDKGGEKHCKGDAKHKEGEKSCGADCKSCGADCPHAKKGDQKGGADCKGHADCDKGGDKKCGADGKSCGGAK